MTMSNKIEEIHGMPLTQIIKSWMVKEGWNDELEIDIDTSTSRISTKMRIEDQSYRLYIDVNEQQKTIDLYLYTPFDVPPKRHDAMAIILNQVNYRNAAGRFGFNYDRTANPVQYLLRIDAEYSQPTLNQISYSLSQACTNAGRFHQLLAATAMTELDANELWGDFDTDNS